MRSISFRLRFSAIAAAKSRITNKNLIATSYFANIQGNAPLDIPLRKRCIFIKPQSANYAILRAPKPPPFTPPLESPACPRGDRERFGK